MKKNFDENEKSETLIALFNLDEDEDNLRTIVKNYASKMAKTDDLKKFRFKGLIYYFALKVTLI